MFKTLFKSGPSILVVDDEITTRATLNARLNKKEGYTVHLAKNGTEALKIAFSKLPKVIILDWKMPDLSGIEVLRQLRSNADTKDIPVLMLTSKNLVSDVELAFEMGAIEYLSKPLDLNLISKKVATYMKVNQETLK